MIQRVQSIFLLLVAICMFAVLFTPIWLEILPESKENSQLTAIALTHTNAEGTSQQTHTFYIAIIAFAAAAVAIGSLLSFKSRMKQLRLNMINSILIGITVILSAYFLVQGSGLIEGGDYEKFGTGAYFLVGALVSNWLANRFIMRDERLVRAADRIR